MRDILERLANSSPDEGSHDLYCRCLDAAEEISALRAGLVTRLKCGIDADIIDRLNWRHLRYETTVATLESDAASEIAGLRAMEEKLVSAVRNLKAAKGRHHTEIAYARLMDVLADVTSPIQHG